MITHSVSLRKNNVGGGDGISKEDGNGLNSVISGFFFDKIQLQVLKLEVEAFEIRVLYSCLQKSQRAF